MKKNVLSIIVKVEGKPNSPRRAKALFSEILKRNDFGFHSPSFAKPMFSHLKVTRGKKNILIELPFRHNLNRSLWYEPEANRLAKLLNEHTTIYFRSEDSVNAMVRLAVRDHRVLNSDYNNISWEELEKDIKSKLS